MGSWNFSVSLLILQEWIQNFLFYFLMVPADFFGEERVFILYNFPYLHLGPFSFKCTILFNYI